MKNDEIMLQYNKNKKLYGDFCHSIYALINNLLEVNGISVHTITCRVKEERSLRKKIEKKNGKYKDVNQITDLIGIRIITYFDDEVDKIAELIEKEFIIDKENSIEEVISRGET